MKKILLKTILFLIPLTGFSQSFTELVSYNSATSNAFDGISGDCNVGIKISTTQNGIYIDHHLQSFDLKTLRIAYKDIPASQVPSYVILDKRVDVTFDLYVNNAFIERHGQPSVTWATLQGLPNSDNYKPATSTNGYKLFNSGAISVRNVKVTKLNYRVKEDYYMQIRNEIAGKSNKSTTENPLKQGNSTSLTIENNSSNNNPTTQTSTTKTSNQTENTIAKPLDNYDPNTGLYTNPMANTSSGSSAADSFNKSYQQGQQIADVATGLVDLFAPSPAQVQRRAAEAAEYERREKADKEAKQRIARERFQQVYMPLLMNKALKGDENARMTLYFASYHLYSTEFVPKRKQWFDEALRNYNFDALMKQIETITKDGGNRILALQHAARLGSVDAMIQLVKWYDMKNTTVMGTKFTGGENPELALEWITKAAEKGSPNAMYYLGMIYKYGMTPDLSNGHGFLKRIHVKYNVIIDETKAFEWFTKSIQPDYKLSLYSKGNYSYLQGACFEKDSFKELAIMYEKGKVVAKDKAKAKELEKMYKDYTSYQTF